MQLRSSSFIDGATIPRRFTCDGEDISPPLTWTGAPTATRSFALFCSDPDAPTGTWHHWGAYDIPANLTILVEGSAADQIEREARKHVLAETALIGVYQR